MKKKKRVIELDTSGAIGEAFHQVIGVYAHAAYPPGGSDCAAATRTALLEVAEKAQLSDQVSISSRQRPMLKAAVKWYYTEVETNNKEVFEVLLSQLQARTKK